MGDRGFDFGFQIKYQRPDPVFLLRLMAASRQMVESDDFATKREAYYISKNWGDFRFDEQAESDAIMDDIEALASMHELSREQLRFYVELGKLSPEYASVVSRRQFARWHEVIVRDGEDYPIQWLVKLKGTFIHR